MDVAGLELGQVGDELDGRFTLAGGEVLEPRDELVVGEALESSEDVVGHASF